jgi:hypothetical protein
VDLKRESPIEQKIEGKPVASWASIFLDYVELKARLLARESKEASGHLIGLIVLTGVVLVLAIASVLMYGGFSSVCRGPAASLGVGLERPHLRAYPYAFGCDHIFCPATAAS